MQAEFPIIGITFLKGVKYSGDIGNNVSYIFTKRNKANALFEPLI